MLAGHEIAAIDLGQRLARDPPLRGGMSGSSAGRVSVSDWPFASAAYATERRVSGSVMFPSAATRPWGRLAIACGERHQQRAGSGGDSAQL